MLKVKVTVPAVCTGLGPGLDALGLALALHNTLEFGLRSDSQLVISTQGEGDDPASLRHPALHAAVRLFQTLERAPAGLTITINNRIPAGCGLGDLAALTVGGLIGANNMLDAPIKRDALIEMGCELTGQPAYIITAMLGGLVATSGTGRDLLYRRLETAALKVVIVVPDVPDYAQNVKAKLPTNPTLQDASFNLGRAALVLEAFRKNDLDLLGRAIQDRLIAPQRKELIPGYEAAIDAAQQAGAVGVALSGDGPALVAFTAVNHKRVEESMQRAFSEAGIRSRAWTVNVDTQGVAISLTR